MTLDQGPAKPLIVEDIIAGEGFNVTAEEMFFYAAWRSFAALRERMDAAPTLQTREQFVAVLDDLAMTYEGLYRAVSYG